MNTEDKVISGTGLIFISICGIVGFSAGYFCSMGVYCYLKH